MPKLIVQHGPDLGREFELLDATVTIGRHSNNTIALTDARVSRRHLELRRTPEGGYRLYDLKSGNGTQVNERLVQVMDLHGGDRIYIGDSCLNYDEFSPAPAEAPSTKANAPRLVLRPTPESPSAILKTISEDTGSRILSEPNRAATDWLRARLANLSVMYEASTAVSQILDVDELLDRLVDLVLRTTEADHGCVMLSDPETGELMPKAIRSRKMVTKGSAPELVVSRTVIEHVLTHREGVLLADAGSDERFRRGASIARHQIREVICVPMKGRHETVGVLFLDTRSKQTTHDPIEEEIQLSASVPVVTTFSEDHLTLAIAVAHQAAIAVEETRYYQALVQSERLAAVGQTIAALSHHIKNIMQGVRFGSDMVRLGLAENDRPVLEKGWRLVEKNQARIDDLMLDMLNFSKEREPVIEPTNVNELVADVLEVVRGRAADSGIEIDWKPGESIPLVSCDPDGIHRAVLNIVGNAVDALRDQDDGRILVTTALASKESVVEIAVQDNGPGIPPDALAEIFKPFTSTKGTRGTGLGLAVSRKILREHGGDVVASSEFRRGSRFVVRVPIESVTQSATLPEI